MHRGLSVLETASPPFGFGLSDKTDQLLEVPPIYDKSLSTSLSSLSRGDADATGR